MTWSDFYLGKIFLGYREEEGFLQNNFGIQEAAVVISGNETVGLA